MPKNINKKTLAARIIIWSLFLLWLCVIFYFSAQQKNDSDKQTVFVIDVLNRIFGLNLSQGETVSGFGILKTVDFLIRKSAHFTEYFILGILSFLAFRDISDRFKKSAVIRPVIASVFCLLYAASDEIHQYFVPGRACKAKDVLIDFSGSVAAVLICLLICAVRNRTKLRREKISDGKQDES